MILSRFNMPYGLFILTAAGLCGGLLATRSARTAAQSVDRPVPVAFDLAAPKLTGGTSDWLNTGGKKLEFNKGAVYIVEFWTFGCINCQRNLPAYTRWQKRFGKQDVVIIGVHTPETDDEKKSENVIKRVKELGITYPVLLDQNGENWNRWEQQVWPTVYLIDKRGHARFRWVGELDWKHAGGEETMARRIDMLLKEKP